MVFMWSPALISSPPSPQDIIIHTQTGGQTLALHYLPPDNITTLSAQFSLLEQINYTFNKVSNHHPKIPIICVWHHYMHIKSS